MEFPNLGEQCSNDSCKQLDFIPLKCQCSLYFCKDHFLNHSLSDECAFNKKEKITIDKKSSIIYKCSSSDCRSASLNKIACEICEEHFCIEHRFHGPCYNYDSETLLAERKKIEEIDKKNEVTRQTIERDVTMRLRQAEQTSQAKTAIKVQLMKLKSKATGEKNIPAIDKVFFAVKYPSNMIANKIVTDLNDTSVKKCKLEDNAFKAVFVSRNWSIGRAIDSISDICNVKNENNVLNSPKLRLFRASDGLCVGITEMHREINSFLKDNTLIDGERLYLEYISENDIKNLEFTAAYFLSL